MDVSLAPGVLVIDWERRLIGLPFSNIYSVLPFSIQYLYLPLQCAQFPTSISSLDQHFQRSYLLSCKDVGEVGKGI